jgi:hypothetical protein
LGAGIALSTFIIFSVMVIFLSLLFRYLIYNDMIGTERYFHLKFLITHKKEKKEQKPEAKPKQNKRGKKVPH